MEFGILKSKIEKVITESYSNKKEFKKNMFLFNELIVNNKNMNKIFYLYDELSINKGLNEGVARDFINECQTIYENTINKINPQMINDLKMWVGDVRCENQYTNIDNLFSNNILQLENKIGSKKLIIETITKQPTVIEESEMKLPLNKIYEVANETINTFLDKLDESDKKKVLEIIKEDDLTLEIKFNVLKETLTERLTRMLNEEESEEIKTTITETINKVSTESYDKLTYVKLRELNKEI
jgi:hypothetical protein